MNGTNFKLNRILASMIDGLIMLLILIGVCVMPALRFFKNLSENSFVLSELMWLLFSIFGSFCLWILYLFVSSLIFRKSTLGMKICHLSFTRSGNKDASYRDILFRELVVVLCLVFSLGFTIILDPISTLCNENGRNFYDLFSRVKVVSSDEIM